MAIMSSMLARAARAACRASRAAASASARAACSAAAAAAASRAACTSTDATAAAAAADLALGTSTTSSREARSLRCDASRGAAPSPRPPHVSYSTRSDGCLLPDDKPQTPVVDEKKAKEFVADAKDLESDEALWSLYERWCKHFNQERDRDEMARRFDEFKRVVLLVHQENNADRPYQLAINKFTDGKLSELYFAGSNTLHQKQLARMAKMLELGSRFIWLNGKDYVEVPEPEESPKTGRFIWQEGKCYMEVPEECQPESASFCIDDKPQTPVVDDKAKEFVADEKDLESDEALWSLYERWCKHFNQKRDHDEMTRRFDEFKRAVLLVHQENNSDRPNQLAINKFTDGKVWLGGDGSKEAEHAAKLPKTGVGYIWLNGKYYMEVPEEELPKTGRVIWMDGKCYMELPEECQPD